MHLSEDNCANTYVFCVRYAFMSRCKHEGISKTKHVCVHSKHLCKNCLIASSAQPATLASSDQRGRAQRAPKNSCLGSRAGIILHIFRIILLFFCVFLPIYIHLYMPIYAYIWVYIPIYPKCQSQNWPDFRFEESIKRI